MGRRALVCQVPAGQCGEEPPGRVKITQSQARTAALTPVRLCRPFPPPPSPPAALSHLPGQFQSTGGLRWAAELGAAACARSARQPPAAAQRGPCMPAAMHRPPGPLHLQTHMMAEMVERDGVPSRFCQQARP